MAARNFSAWPGHAEDAMRAQPGEKLALEGSAPDAFAGPGRRFFVAPQDSAAPRPASDTTATASTGAGIIPAPATTD